MGIILLVGGLGLTQTVGAHGDLHERIEAISAQLCTNQADANLWLLRADLHRQHGAMFTALADVERAAKLKPGWSAVNLQRARIGFDSENYAGTVAAATDCLKLDASNADALVLRARSFVRLNKFALAVADYDAVLNVSNSAAPLPDLYLERARTQVALKCWDAAIRGLDVGMERMGATPSLALPAIEYERQRGDFAAALQRLERAKIFFSVESYGKLRAEILKQAGKK